MPPYLETAVLVCEDGRFFGHHGFDPRAIESAIRDNVSAGRFLRGASTVTMQLAKNLYLSRDKQLSRKFQEAALTLLLEQELTKPDLLELYFNIVEFGPGVYGVRQAAQHYFGVTPDHLTIGQSFFLVSILPNPKRLYFDESGKLLPARATYLHRLMNIAYDRGRLTDAELAQGLAEEVRLGPPTGSESLSPDAGVPNGPAPTVPGRDMPSATPGRDNPNAMRPITFPNDAPASGP
jgi:membrane peptidoglycan carboxypeptidase